MNEVAAGHPIRVGASEALVGFHQLVESEVIVMARSSYSRSAALIGNRTVLSPSCDDRHPLPHWRVFPCAPEAKDGRLHEALRSVLAASAPST